MSEARLERTRQVNREINCDHQFWIVGDTHLAPIILENKNRRTVEQCFKCGYIRHCDRTHEEFLRELERYIPFSQRTDA